MIILGAARQGTALARYLAVQGASVTLTDMRASQELNTAQEALKDLEIQWVLGEHPDNLLDGASLVCPSGGVPLTIPFLQQARSRGIPFSNDSQIFLQAAPCPAIGITGSAGKTTTTTLVGRIAHAAVDSGEAQYQHAFIGGNIGNPLIAQLDEIGPSDIAVMELSSFQLDLMTASPHIAAVLNISPNHLDRHGSMQAYTAAKRHILEHQTSQDIAVLGRDDENAWALRDSVKGQIYSFGFLPLPPGGFGSYLQDGNIWIKTPALQQPAVSLSDIQIPGDHNILNVLAAAAICAAAELPIPAIGQGVAGFTGVPHRLEFVRRWKDTDWYNDSKATGPEMAVRAIQAFSQPLILLAGGRDKDLPWDKFAQAAARRVDHLVLFGKAAPVIQAALLPDSPFSLDICAGLHEAVSKAAALAQPGDVVLLAPGGDSFDEFDNFEHRGESFKSWVNQLA
ncbi:MAG: UDP-N-acetylmuramoyl-L-alanine--D-glutamate ligase [Anaerolineae bacterium]|nr:UDP-N-acetylmuramoyl-L-alanine--D-glutamate ligase [Anaerolineae bacterium]